MKRDPTELEDYYLDEEEKKIKKQRDYYCYDDDPYESFSPQRFRLAHGGYQVSSDFMGDMRDTIEDGKLEVVKDMLRIAEEYSLEVDEELMILDTIVWDRVEILEYLVSKGMKISAKNIQESYTSPEVTKYLFKNGYDLKEAEKEVEPDDQFMTDLYKKFKLIEKLKEV